MEVGQKKTRAKRITQEQTEQVILFRGKMTAKEIATTVGVTYDQVNEVFKRYNMTNKNNINFKINDLQNQIFLSGKLGDGNYKPNGKYNYYYRESHAEDEREYLIWKMNSLGDMINNQGLYPIKKAGWNVQQSYGFSTKTSPSLIQYVEMSMQDTILQLNEKGLIMFMLDDGWFTKHSKCGNFCISGGVLTKEDLDCLCEQFNKYNIKDVHIVGQKRLDVSIPSFNNKLLYDITTSFIPCDTDIVMKKFKYIKTN